eukprot:jgi/Chlat1/8396/Chrsp80S07832
MMQDNDSQLEEDVAPHGRSVKRQKRGPTLRPGSIRTVRVVQFMTYSECTLEPGSNLNVIFGPNGSGKSSFVCAIALGLGASPKLLGRAEHIDEYIMRTKYWGTTEISIVTETGDDVVIFRKLIKEKPSEWKLNGKQVLCKPVGVRTIEKKVKELGIQLDNLCQFLPQDRVCEFAKLNPAQLLVETEKAVGDPELLAQHHQLVELGAKLRALDQNVRKHTDRLDRLQQQNRDVEKDVTRLQERQAIEEQINLMKLKLPWLAYHAAKQQLDESKNKEKEAKAVRTQRRAELTQFDQPIKAKKEERQRCKVAAENARRQIEQTDQSKTSLMVKLFELENKVATLDQQLEHSRQDRADRAQKLIGFENEVQRLQSDLDKEPEITAPPPDLERLDAEASALEKQMVDVQSNKQVAEEELVLPRRQLEHLQSKLAEYSSTKAQKMRYLAQLPKMANLPVVYAEVQRRQQEFKEPVYGPLLLEVNVPVQEHAKYLEMHCARSVWTSFVTTNREDAELLREVVQNAGCLALCTNYAADPNAPLQHPSGDASQYTNYGITHTLDEVFEAPLVVKHVICDLSAVNCSYVGTRETESMQDELFQRTPIQDLYMPDGHIRKTVSRYANSSSLASNQIRSARLIIIADQDATERDTMLNTANRLELEVQQMTAYITQLAAQERELESKAAALRSQHGSIHKTYMESKRNRQRIANTLKQKLERYNRFKAERPSHRSEEEILGEIDRVNKKRLKQVLQLQGVLASLPADMMAEAAATLAFYEVDEQVAGLEQDKKAISDALQQAERIVEQCASIVAGDKARCQTLHKKAVEEAPLTDELKEVFTTFATNSEQLLADIQAKELERDGIHCLNPHVLEQYHRRKEEIAEMEQQLAESQNLREHGLADVNAVKDKWLPEVRTLAERINASFSRFFSEAARGCEGQVSLVEHEDFSKLEMQIRVKYRATESLQILSAQRQSGGERSVATMLYLLSMQDLTSCPFRVVDEINQGMDPTNERTIFRQLVQITSRPDTPQCFLLTPKLLPDLEYSDRVTALSIWNGPYIKDTTANFEPEHLLTGLPSIAARG